MGLITLGKQNGRGSRWSVRAVTLKQGPRRCPGGRRYTKKARSPDSDSVRKNTCFVLLGPNHTQPAKADFFGVCTPFPRQGGPPETQFHWESGLNQRDRATCGFVQFQTNRMPGRNKSASWAFRLLLARARTHRAADPCAVPFLPSRARFARVSIATAVPNARRGRVYCAIHHNQRRCTATAVPTPSCEPLGFMVLEVLVERRGRVHVSIRHNYQSFSP